MRQTYLFYKLRTFYQMKNFSFNYQLVKIQYSQKDETTTNTGLYQIKHNIII